MNDRRYLFLIVLALVAVLAAVFVARERAPTTSAVGEQALVPQLAETINDVSAIRATGAGGAAIVTLTRGDNAWTVEQKSGYPADPAKVRQFLIDLSEARLAEQKTQRAENYARLGVEDVAGAEAGGLQIELDGVTAPAVVLGDSARGGDGRYVRRAGEETSWVADRPLNFAKTSVEWVNRDLFDIDAARVQRVTISQADGTQLVASRGTVNFEIADLPEGKVLTSPTAVNPLASVLDGFRLEDVLAAADVASEEPPVETHYETSDGLVLTARTFEVDAATYATFEAVFDESALAPLPLPDTGDPAAGDSDVDGPAAASEVATDSGAADDASVAAAESSDNAVAAANAEAEAARAEVARINQRVVGWVYKIPRFKFDQMRRNVDHFVRDEES